MATKKELIASIFEIGCKLNKQLKNGLELNTTIPYINSNKEFIWGDAGLEFYPIENVSVTIDGEWRAIDEVDISDMDKDSEFILTMGQDEDSFEDGEIYRVSCSDKKGMEQFLDMIEVLSGTTA